MCTCVCVCVCVCAWYGQEGKLCVYRPCHAVPPYLPTHRATRGFSNNKKKEGTEATPSPDMGVVLTP